MRNRIILFLIAFCLVNPIAQAKSIYVDGRELEDVYKLVVHNNGFFDDNAILGFGNTSGSPDLKIYSDGTDTFFTGLNLANITIEAAGNSAVQDAGILSLAGGLQTDTEAYYNGYVRTGKTVAWVDPSIGGVASVGGNAANFAVGNHLYVVGQTRFAGAVAFKTGATGAGGAPFFLTSGSLMSSPYVGAFEFLTDDIYFTITTGTSRKNIILGDTKLVSGRVPFSTTNSRLTDSSSFTWSAVSGLVITGLNLSAAGGTLTSLNVSSTSSVLTFTDTTAGDDDYTITVNTDDLTINNTTLAGSEFVMSGATGNIAIIGAFTSSNTGSLGWSIVDQTDNQACTTGCTSACVFGIDNATGTAVTNLVSCAATTSDLCACAGAS